MTVELLRIHAVDSEIGIPMHLRYTGPCMHVHTRAQNCNLQLPHAHGRLMKTYVADIKSCTE